MPVTLDAEESSALAGTSSYVEASWLQPGTALAQAFKGFLSGRPFHQCSANFLRGLQLHRDYRNQKDFSTWAGKDMATCPHKARLLVGVELWLLAGRGLWGDMLLEYGLEIPLWGLGDPNSEGDTRQAQEGDTEGNGVTGVWGYLCKGGCF